MIARKRFGATIAFAMAASLLLGACQQVVAAPPPADAPLTTVSSSAVRPLSNSTSPVLPASSYTDAQLNSIVSRVDVHGARPNVLDPRHLRWAISATTVEPDQCEMLVDGLAEAAARGLPASIGTMAWGDEAFTITVVGVDDDTRGWVLAERNSAAKRCSRLTTTTHDPQGTTTASTRWVVRHDDAPINVDDAVAVDLSTTSPERMRVVSGRVGHLLIQVNCHTNRPPRESHFSEVVDAVAAQARAAEGSPPRPPAPPTPSP